MVAWAQCSIPTSPRSTRADTRVLKLLSGKKMCFSLSQKLPLCQANGDATNAFQITRKPRRAAFHKCMLVGGDRVPYCWDQTPRGWMIYADEHTWITTGQPGGSKHAPRTKAVLISKSGINK